MDREEHAERVGNEEQRRRDPGDIEGAWREDPAFEDAKARQDVIDASQIEDILQRVDAMPTLDHRSSDQVVGYKDDGLPD